MVLGQMIFLTACFSYCVWLSLGELALSERIGSRATTSLPDEDALCWGWGEERLRNQITSLAVFLAGALLKMVSENGLLQIPVF